MAITLPAKDPDDVEPYFVVWCDEDSTNDGSAGDDGELQGATISTSEWTVPSGITRDSDNTDAITIKGVTFLVDTVAAIWVSSGTIGMHELTNKIITSDGRTLSQSITIEVKEK
jgi:hypothetical protein